MSSLPPPSLFYQHHRPGRPTFPSTGRVTSLPMGAGTVPLKTVPATRRSSHLARSSPTLVVSLTGGPHLFPDIMLWGGDLLSYPLSSTVIVFGTEPGKEVELTPWSWSKRVDGWQNALNLSGARVSTVEGYHFMATSGQRAGFTSGQPAGFTMDPTIIRKNLDSFNFVLVTPVANCGNDIKPVNSDLVAASLAVELPALELKLFADEMLLSEVTEAGKYTNMEQLKLIANQAKRSPLFILAEVALKGGVKIVNLMNRNDQRPFNSRSVIFILP